ncbi:matrixin family metalloprotease [Cerasicoccus fimbriatus]|uniref:matrixin family metalloprotease n=1 Tax=Cerasicoccus fimbriatus TaxID=3014554 RepID=UPI0022B51CBA|nr:matrixin family metalloprotease [Cerasicoccus sp. TK19100]
MTTRFALLITFALGLTAPVLNAACAESQTAAQAVEQADAIAVAGISHLEYYLSTTGEIRTKALITVNETIKGALPDRLYASQSGGSYGNEHSYVSMYSALTPEDRALVMLANSPDGPEFCIVPNGMLPLPADPDSDHLTSSENAAEYWLTEIREYCTDNPQDGVDFTAYGVTKIARDATSTGLLGDTTPSRFLAPDRGRPIPVIYNDSTRPPGITEAQCLEALEEALAAWEGVCTVRFQIIGKEDFIKSTREITVGEVTTPIYGDEVILIDFHDNFDQISNASTTLGVGGRSAVSSSIGPVGGTVGEFDFFHSTKGYVVLDHEKTSLQSLEKLKQVLTHELGHVIGLSHSSEDPNETDPFLKAATMYFRISNDGRGASVRDWDVQFVNLIHPLNHPPYAFSQYFKLVNAPSPILSDEINRYRLAVGDLDGDELTVEILDTFDSGRIQHTFINDNTGIELTPLGLSFDLSTEPTSFFQGRRMLYRVSDGVNKSPVVTFSMKNLFLDQNPI